MAALLNLTTNAMLTFEELLIGLEGLVRLENQSKLLNLLNTLNGIS